MIYAKKIFTNPFDEICTFSSGFNSISFRYHSIVGEGFDSTGQINSTVSPSFVWKTRVPFVPNLGGAKMLKLKKLKNDSPITINSKSVSRAAISLTA